MMNNSRDYNNLLREYDQIVKVIPLLGEVTCDLAIRSLANRLADIESILDRATSRVKTLKELIAEKKAQLLPQNSGN